MVINGKTYTPARLTFSAMRKMERSGLTVNDIGSRPLEFLTLYLALSMGNNTDVDTAAAELDAHLDAGGDLNEISEALDNAVRASGFFREETTETKAK